MVEGELSHGLIDQTTLLRNHLIDLGSACL